MLGQLFTALQYAGTIFALVVGLTKMAAINYKNPRTYNGRNMSTKGFHLVIHITSMCGLTALTMVTWLQGPSTEVTIASLVTLIVGTAALLASNPTLDKLLDFGAHKARAVNWISTFGFAALIILADRGYQRYAIPVLYGACFFLAFLPVQPKLQVQFVLIQWTFSLTFVIGRLWNIILMTRGIKMYAAAIMVRVCKITLECIVWFVCATGVADGLLESVYRLPLVSAKIDISEESHKQVASDSFRDLASLFADENGVIDLSYLDGVEYTSIDDTLPRQISIDHIGERVHARAFLIHLHIVCHFVQTHDVYGLTVWKYLQENVDPHHHLRTILDPFLENCDKPVVIAGKPTIRWLKTMGSMFADWEDVITRAKDRRILLTTNDTPIGQWVAGIKRGVRDTIEKCLSGETNAELKIPGFLATAELVDVAVEIIMSTTVYHEIIGHYLFRFRDPIRSVYTDPESELWYLLDLVVGAYIQSSHALRPQLSEAQASVLRHANEAVVSNVDRVLPIISRADLTLAH
jgi:hypothetical protein